MTKTSDPTDAARAGDERGATTALRARIRTELDSARSLIAALQRDLDDYRQRNRDLESDRSRLERKLIGMDAARLELRQAQSRWRECAAQLRKDQSARDALTQQNIELAERCAELDHGLESEREAHQLCRLENDNLRSQIAELEAIVALLSEDGR